MKEKSEIETMIKRTIHIGLCVLNILLAVDFYLLAILKEQTNSVYLKSIFQFWINPDYMDIYSNENSLAFFYADILVKLLALTLLLLLIIRNRDTIFNWILLKIILVIYGGLFIYTYIFFELVCFQFSSFVKF